MNKIGFLSHSDSSIYYFRFPIMKALRDLGCEVFAICPYGRFVDKIKKEFNYIDYRLDQLSINPFKIIFETIKLSQILKDLNLDLIQTSAHKSNIFGTFAAKKAKVKTIINLVEGLGNSYIDNNFKNLFIRNVIEILYKISFKISNACIFVNDSDPDYMLKKRLLNYEKIIKIKSVGVDSNKFYPKNIETDKKIILMVSRPIKNKGLLEFNEASKILNRNDCEFVYVGANFDKSDIDIKNLKNIKSLGFVDDLSDILNSAYIFVLPSYKEGLPKSILEAMSCAKPVVATNVSGCNEIVISEYNGLLCEPKNPFDLAKKIEFLLENENLTKKMGKNARQMIVENFDEKIIIEKYLNFYRNFINV